MFRTVVGEAFGVARSLETNAAIRPRLSENRIAVVPTFVILLAGSLPGLVMVRPQPAVSIDSGKPHLLAVCQFPGSSYRNPSLGWTGNEETMLQKKMPFQIKRSGLNDMRQQDLTASIVARTSEFDMTCVDRITLFCSCKTYGLRV